MLPSSNWLFTPHPAPCRQQFRLACTAQGLLLTSLGANPTKVWLGAHDRTQAVLLQKGKPGWGAIHMMLTQQQQSPACLHPQHKQAGGAKANLASSQSSVLSARPPPRPGPTGETRLLSVGDRVLLLGCDPSMFVEVTAATVPAETGGSAAADGAAGGATVEGGAEPPSKRLRLETDAAATAGASQQQQQQLLQGDGTAGAAAAAAAGPVLLVLVGAQGAGKSTFCHNLKQATERPGITRRWSRVNQDTIASESRWEVLQEFLVPVGLVFCCCR